MTGRQLRRYRKVRKWTQERAALLLGVSQTYLSLLENGERSLNEKLQRRVVSVFGLSPEKVPTRYTFSKLRNVSDEQLASDLAALGYPGFSHLRPSARKNPAELVLSALNADKRDARLVEALPWVIYKYPNLDWAEMVKAAKVYDLQNRLGFVVSVARDVAEANGESKTAEILQRRAMELERSLLVRQNTLCNESMTAAEREWLADHRSETARKWNLLTDTSAEHLNYE